MINKVLLADDDCDDAEVFREALSKVCPKAQFVRVENGRKLFQLLEQSTDFPDLIFLDLNMPELNGWQCLAKLKNASEFSEIPVVMYTTSSNPRDREIAQDLNAHGLITKPSDHRILEKVLDLIVCNFNKENLKTALLDAYLIAKQ